MSPLAESSTVARYVAESSQGLSGIPSIGVTPSLRTMSPHLVAIAMFRQGCVIDPNLQGSSLNAENETVLAPFGPNR